MMTSVDDGVVMMEDLVMTVAGEEASSMKNGMEERCPLRGSGNRDLKQSALGIRTERIVAASLTIKK